MLQIRISAFDGSNPIILENAKNRTVSRVINSSDEGVSFSIAKNDPKAYILSPYDEDTPSKRWEVWDTETNERINYGAITDIKDTDYEWTVTGAGRSSLLSDFYKTKKTFYAPIFRLVDDLRFENIAVEPRTTTIVPDVDLSPAEITVFGPDVNVDEKYHGISKNTKDNAIDDNNGLFKVGEIEKPNSHYTTDSFWSGMSRADSHITDLGDVYPISKIEVNLPSWGGPVRLYNRSYDYSIAIASSEGGPVTTVQGRDFTAFEEIHDTGDNSRTLGGVTLYIGRNPDDSLEVSTNYLDLPPVEMRYLRVAFRDAHAWYGSNFDGDPAVDRWDYQCDPDYTDGAMKEEINTRVLEPANNCFASITEIGMYKEILERENIASLAIQRIDNNNRQITYSHSPAAGETFSTASGYRKFEPGSFFRKLTVSYSGANTAYTKFFNTDCDNCFPDGFNFGVMDQNNSLVYATDSSSGSQFLRLGAYTKHIMMKGASNAVVTFVDAWRARTDPLSYGGSYSFTEVQDDYAVIHFRGESFRWYATVPSNKTGANVSVKIRNKDTNGNWTAFTTLSTFDLPSGISNELVYEITYESGDLLPNTVYDIKITNEDGGFCSIDSIEGYWSASMVEYNEDSPRIYVNKPERFKQIYDERFSGGSMYKVTDSAFTGFIFTGDRIIVTSAKGRNHGTARIVLIDKTLGNEYDPGVSNHVFIPSGPYGTSDPSDGTLAVDLDTGKRGNEITQFVLFDSNDFFTGGLPWGTYHLMFFLRQADLETYSSTTAEQELDSFVPRCEDCVAPTGDPVTVNKPVFLDSIFAHEIIGVSVAFEQETHLEILKALAETLQVEWTITEEGLKFLPRIGTDTDEYLREGENTLVNWDIVNDFSQIATMLLSHGSDIDGLPLFTITEDKKTRARIGRTIMRQHDFRDIAEYGQLIGLSRAELKRRSYPQKRITVTHIAEHLPIDEGDSFLLWTSKMGTIRVRILRKSRNESSGRSFELECVTWPEIT